MADQANPAIIDMSNIEEIQEEEFKEQQRTTSQSSTASADLFSTISNSVWNEGRQRAQTAFKSYTNIDLLRPYFDVEPNEVVHRLLHSFRPIKPSLDSNEKVHSELYGPIMICFTLVALLLFEMKSSDHSVQEGTLMGSALITCFGYWLGASAVLWLVAYVGGTHLRPMQINTLLGYGLSGHCLVILLNTIIHTTHSHIFFYVTWVLFGGLCTARVITVFISKTPGHTERLVATVTIGVLHMLFLLYLHFAYHKIVQDLNSVIVQKAPQPLPNVGKMSQ